MRNFMMQVMRPMWVVILVAGSWGTAILHPAMKRSAGRRAAAVEADFAVNTRWLRLKRIIAAIRGHRVERSMSRIAGRAAAGVVLLLLWGAAESRAEATFSIGANLDTYITEHASLGGKSSTHASDTQMWAIGSISFRSQPLTRYSLFGLAGKTVIPGSARVEYHMQLASPGGSAVMRVGLVNIGLAANASWNNYYFSNGTPAYTFSELNRRTVGAGSVGQFVSWNLSTSLVQNWINAGSTVNLMLQSLTFAVSNDFVFSSNETGPPLTKMSRIVFDVASGPIANAGPDLQLNLGDHLLLSAAGSSSTNAGGSLTSYRWDLNSDGVFDFFGPSLLLSGSQYSPFLTGLGTFNVTLEVGDNFGLTGSDLLVIETFPEQCAVMGVENVTQGTFHCRIQSAIDQAVNGDEIVVAPGTYNELINFNGKAITVRSSDPTNPAIVATTIIDGTGLTDSVVKCIGGETASTVLDGFTVTNGSAGSSGGGMFNSGASPTVTNCTFSGNIVSSAGGAMYNSNSSPTVTNCTFSGNTASAQGGGMVNNSSSPTVTNCTFSGNTAPNSVGGGMFNSSSSPMVTNCTFSGNAAVSGGGMFNNNGSSPTVTNCTFSTNTATNNSGGGMANQLSNPTMTNCIFWANSDLGGMDESAQISVFTGTPVVNFSDVQGGWTGAGGTGNINADPLFVDADGADNVVGTEDDDLRLSPGSPCIDAGDNGAVPGSVTTDLDGNPRFIDEPCLTDTGVGTPPIVDMGAYESPPALSVPADRDCDGDVDGIDFTVFASCFNKAGNPPRTVGCDPGDRTALDFDGDNDIDGIDFTAFASCFNKAGNPPRTLGCPQN